MSKNEFNKVKRASSIYPFLILLLFFISSCSYFRLFRPKVLKQVDPEVAQLLNELPEIDSQNEAIIGRLFAHGGLSHAEKGKDGVMRDKIKIPSGEFIWKPAIIVMESPGELELEVTNEDKFTQHAMILPSNGDKQYLDLPMQKRGLAKIKLDGPGYYWFGCPVANHAGRGMLGLVLVKGEVPEEAQLDRPQEKRP